MYFQGLVEEGVFQFLELEQQTRNSILVISKEQASWSVIRFYSADVLRHVVRHIQFLDGILKLALSPKVFNSVF